MSIKRESYLRRKASRFREHIFAKNADEVMRAATNIGKQVVVKAQILVAGRGKAGGVKLAANSEEARRDSPTSNS